MIIQVDKEGENIIQQLCDVALKQGGIKNLNAINKTLSSLKVIEEPKLEDKNNKEPN